MSEDSNPEIINKNTLNQSESIMIEENKEEKAKSQSSAEDQELQETETQLKNVKEGVLADSAEESKSLSPLDFNNLDTIKQYITKYKGLKSKFEEDFMNPANLEYFIISKKFINEWKNYIGFEEIEKNILLPKSYGKNEPEPYNQDLIDEANSETISICKGSENDVLKPNLTENNDFEIVNKEIMEFFEKNFKGRTISRKAYILPDGHKRIEIYYKTVNVVFITHTILKDSETLYKENNEFKAKKLQIFSQNTLNYLKEQLLEILNEASKKSRESSSYYYSSIYYPIYKIDQVRFWKLDPEVSLTQAYEYVRKSCRSQQTYDYRIEMKGKYLDNNGDMKLSDLNLSESEYLILEVREENKGWNFIQDGIPNIEKCEYCNRFGNLTSYCVCKKVGYCNDECRIKDKRFHSMKCDRADEEEEEKDYKITAESRLGLTGLSNLGNTCFMNSALQCISNTYGLTKYFIEKRFLKEINLTNPLGSKGKLADKYWGLIKNLWVNKNSVYSPYGIKSAVASINSIFSGYNQHDSQEFLSFLLDGLHEDLNRVQEKPLTKTIESDGRPDDIVAKESWLNHLKRNNSIITDLLHGQYRSEITCPACKHVSITFDPFLTCTLPIPNKKEKKIEFYFLFSDNRILPLKFEFTYIKEKDNIMFLKKKTIEKMQIKYPDLALNEKDFSFFFLGTGTSAKVSDQSLIDEIKKKHKLYNLFAVQRHKSLLNIPDEEIIDVPVSFYKREYYYTTHYSKKQFTFVRPISFLLSDTLNQMHMRIFNYFRFIFEESLEKEELEEFLKFNDLEAYAKLFGKPDEKPYEIQICTNSRGYWNCYFCDNNRCDNCKLEENDENTLKSLLDKIKNKEFSFELEVYWPKDIDGVDFTKRFTKCDTFEKKGTEEEEKSISRGYSSSYYNKNKSNNNEEKNLNECFEMFESVEQLTEDNMWYCGKCKSHKLAQKQMKIYKAPQYLAIHLKRFKGSQGFLSSGIISTKVNFPLELDISKYVINKSLTIDYLKTEEKNEEIIEKNVSEPLFYDLYAVSNHFGSANCGHYTAFGKNAKSGEWYNFDDSSVSGVSAESVIGSSAAYILFYERRGIINKDLNFDIQKSEETKEETKQNTNIIIKNGIEEIQYQNASLENGIENQDNNQLIEINFEEENKESKAIGESIVPGSSEREAED